MYESYLLVDVGNRVTKAALVEETQRGPSLLGVATAETTVGPPVLDAVVGVRRSLEALEESSGRRLLVEGRPRAGLRFMLTSSAGGGLHMVVVGVTSLISGESGQRAALGAGAYVAHLLSKDDGQPVYVKVERLRSARPDILLLVGGTDGGAVDQVLEMAQLVARADIRPRFGAGYPLPVVYAGNVEVRQRVQAILGGERYALRVVGNVRPTIERENLGPAREAIYDSYMEHVVVHSPGFKELLQWTRDPLLPSQAATGRLLYAYAQRKGVNLLCLDVGGDTTDVYSVYNGVFNRSISADVGVSFGALNILKLSGVEGVSRWLPQELGEGTLRNMVANMVVRDDPPSTPEKRAVQAAVAREAARLALERHKEVATRLKGTLRGLTISAIFDQTMEDTIVDLGKTHLVVAMGKAFTSQPPLESAKIVLDALEPVGATELALDRKGLAPHLGCLLGANAEAALQLFQKSLTPLATLFSAPGRPRRGGAVEVRLTKVDGTERVEIVEAGEVRAIPLGPGETAEAVFTPRGGLDLGAGRGKALKTLVQGGEVGVVVDARGRPLPAGGEGVAA